MADHNSLNRRAMSALGFEGFLTRFGSGIVAFALPLYAYSLDMSLPAIGLLMSLNIGVAAATKPIIAGFVDKIGYRRSAVISTFMRVAILALLLVSATPLALYAVQVLRGVAKSYRDPALQVLIASYGGKKTLASAFAWYGTAKSVATSLGKSVAGVMLGFWAGLYSLPFALALIPTAVPIFLLLSMVDQIEVKTPPVTKKPRPKRGPTLSIMRDLWPVMGFGFMVSSTGRMLRGLLPILAVEYAGLNEAAAGGLYLVGAVITLLCAPVFGWVSDNMSRQFVLAIRGVANATSSLLYAFLPGMAGFYAAKAVDSLGAAAFKPAWGVLMAEAASSREGHKGRVMGVLGASRDAGTLVGPVIGGTLWALFGPVPMLLIRATLALGTEAYIHLFLRRRLTLSNQTGPEKQDIPTENADAAFTGQVDTRQPPARQ